MENVTPDAATMRTAIKAGGAAAGDRGEFRGLIGGNGRRRHGLGIESDAGQHEAGRGYCRNHFHHVAVFPVAVRSSNRSAKIRRWKTRRRKIRRRRYQNVACEMNTR